MDKKVYSVSKINKYIKSIFENDVFLSDIYIMGEISNYKLHSSGHIYFTLKDEYSTINCVMFKMYASQLEFIPENGMKVVVYGYISVYEKTGQFQLYACNIVNAGQGFLYEQFEKLKNKLLAEGLFDADNKKKIPIFPKCIAVVTSPTGAAIQDIIRIISRRNKNVKITIVPALVQGDGASEDIAYKIKMADLWGKADTIIVGRGGGSAEDLWAFNEEVVARAIYNAKTPIISAVGHETDFTIADFVADLRASTPSAAAEMAVPQTTDFEEKISLLNKKLIRSIETKFMLSSDKYNRLKNSYSFKHFEDKIYNLQIQIEKYKEMLKKDVNNKLKDYKNGYFSLLSHIEAVSPITVLKRGFSIIEDKNGKVIKSNSDININDELKIILNEGTLNARVISKE